MIMKKEELRVIPTKNYLILAIVLLVSFLLIYYLYMWVDAYNETKLNKPILDKYMEVIKYNELDNYLVESPNAIIYVSILENSEIRKFEKDFKACLKSHQITRDLLYMDITEELKDDSIRTDMDMKYIANNVSMTNVPVIMVIDNGALTGIYDIKSNGYDIESLKLYINSIKFSNDGEIYG